MSTTTAKSRRYMPAEVGLDKNNKPYGFHVEGNIAANLYTSPATEGKKTFVSVRMAVPMSVEMLMAMADGTYDKDANYGEGPGFLSLRIFGSLAEEFSKVCAIGLHVAVSGAFEWRTYPKKDGSGEGRELILNVNHLVVMGGKNIAPQVSDDIGVATRCYVGKDNVTRSMPMATLVSGRVVGTRAIQKSNSGHDFLSFGVLAKMPAEKVYDLTNGTYDKNKEYDAKKCIINVTVFDKAAIALSKVIRDGAEVVVSGPVEKREYDGGVSYQMRARVCSLMKFAPLPEGDASQAAAPGATPAPVEAPSEGFSAISDEDDVDLPF